MAIDNGAVVCGSGMSRCGLQQGRPLMLVWVSRKLLCPSYVPAGSSLCTITLTSYIHEFT